MSNREDFLMLFSERSTDYNELSHMAHRLRSANGVDAVDRIGGGSREAYDRLLSIADRVQKSRLS